LQTQPIKKRQPAAKGKNALAGKTNNSTRQRQKRTVTETKNANEKEKANDKRNHPTLVQQTLHQTNVNRASGADTADDPVTLPSIARPRRRMMRPDPGDEIQVMSSAPTDRNKDSDAL
jgi:hypothetical protein